MDVLPTSEAASGSGMISDCSGMPADRMLGALDRLLMALSRLNMPEVLVRPRIGEEGPDQTRKNCHGDALHCVC